MFHEDTHLTFHELTTIVADRDGFGWTEVFQSTWDDERLRRRVIAMANDMIVRGASIPIELERDQYGALRVVDGQLRVYAAWILRLDEVPVHITPAETNA